MQAQRQADGGLEASAATTFDALAWEIELAGARCIFLDKLIGELMKTTPESERTRLIEGMQAVDLLSQHLTGLSAFARKVSENVCDEVMVPVQAAIDDITLGVLADRMSTAFGGEEMGINQGDDAGDLDLF
ncbi:MAG: hypothetical protein Q8Q88_10690 [Phenylobacterium sp.]|uniref:hypothetical protein n=1 Tax=Phenylobacterium sp. TaxID=1871053 RepID=UPI0027366890|nr:hypothetical protein [Phenylobacterium sp.]MDP3747501.1 hypothetical protein [Phenylobacterium sp.]